MATTSRGISRSLLPPARTRAAIAHRLSAVTGAITTATIAEMDRRHAWFKKLDADNRSWITLVAQAGIDGFTRWFADPDAAGSSTAEIFGKAPRELARKISLHQTVELVRTTIEVVETQIDEVMPRGDRPFLQAAIVRYSREVAFAAAEIYARAAEMRGSWDARLEALVVDAVIRGETDENVLSRVSTLGWRTTTGVAVTVGPAPEAEHTHAIEEVRRIAAKSRVDMLAAIQGDRLVVVLGGPQLESQPAAVSIVQEFTHVFGPGPVVVGPVVDHLMESATSTRAALSGFRAAVAWPEAPRPVGSHDLLPERALAGDGHARRALARDLYDPLAEAGGGLLDTLVAFFDSGSSVEATSRVLFVHANTVRYRLKRIHEISGYSPTDPRDSYALRLSLTLGRLLKPASPERPGE